MNVHQLACKWLLQQPALTSITGTFLNEKEIAEACEATSKPDLSTAELTEIAKNYARIGISVQMRIRVILRAAPIRRAWCEAAIFRRRF